jgi:hypothetical protein
MGVRELSDFKGREGKAKGKVGLNAMEGGNEKER